jgi:lipopolysaccharide transport system ATP-binding protein
MGTQEATIGTVHLFDGQDRAVDWVYSGSSLTIELEYLLQKPLPDMALTLGIYTESNIKCFETHISSTRAAFGPLAEKGRLLCHLPEIPLLPGHYYINVGFWPTDWSFFYDYHWQMHPLTVVNEKTMSIDVTGVVLIRPNWSARLKD